MPSTNGNDLCLDTLRRPLQDLRISVTDRCNLRCTYCMPREVFGKGFTFLQHGELLGFEEITRLARVAISLGVRKIRLSGGEPLLRHGVERLIEQLAALRDAEGRSIELAMTTNGTLLTKKARALKDAGLTRLTVSLDALDGTVFRRMSDTSVDVGKVLDGIATARAVGLMPVKVNTVIRSGINEQEILPLIRYFRSSGIILRFIEFMDVGTTNGWQLDDVVTVQDILARINVEFPLIPVDPGYSGEVAKRWKFVDGCGEIGVVASVTQPFCRECTRLRISTDGKLFTCLFAGKGTDVRSLLRLGASDAQLRGRLAKLWNERGDRYSLLRSEAAPLQTKKIEMSYIGG